MRVHDVTYPVTTEGLERQIRGAIAAAPPDVVLQVRVPQALLGAAPLRAASLRGLGPPTANVTVAVRRQPVAGAAGPGPRAPLP
jgi:hypothetical protein